MLIASSAQLGRHEWLMYHERENEKCMQNFVEKYERNIRTCKNLRLNKIWFQIILKQREFESELNSCNS
jgi:hypothetical protein